MNIVVLHTVLLKHEKYPITVRQFGEGALEAGKEKGISVIIDNFRASNTMLVLLEAGAIVTPAISVEHALSFENYITIGELDGKKHPLLDYDNSPSFFYKNGQLVKDRNVVIKTTNGTRGIINAMGSLKIIVGAFRNLSAVINYCLPFAQKRIPISFVAMGSRHISRIEDVIGAKMMYYKLIELLDNPKYLEIQASPKNPWNNDWKQEILNQRKLTEKNREDRLFALNLDESKIIPVYDEQTGRLSLAQQIGAINSVV